MEKGYLLCAEAKFKNLILEISFGSVFNIFEENAALLYQSNEKQQSTSLISSYLVGRGGSQILNQLRRIKPKYSNQKLPYNILTEAGRLNYTGLLHAFCQQSFGQKVQSTDNRPFWNGRLQYTIKNALHIASLNKFKTLVFPLFSCGNIGLHFQSSAQQQIRGFLQFDNQNFVFHLQKVIFCLYQDQELEAVIAQFFQQGTGKWQNCTYYGSPIQQGNCIGKSYCQYCKQIQTQEQAILTQNCCNLLCDYCIYQQNWDQCIYCNESIEGKNLIQFIQRNRDLILRRKTKLEMQPNSVFWKVGTSRENEIYCDVKRF